MRRGELAGLRWVDVDFDHATVSPLLNLAFLLTWEGRHEDAIRMVGVSKAQRDRAGGGPMPGFGGMLEGDPVDEASVHLTEDAAQRAWQEGLAMGVPEAVALVNGGTRA